MQSIKLLESRRAAFKRQLGICFWCGKALSKAPLLHTSSQTAEHLLPKSRGGTLDKQNIVAACLKCNNERGDKCLFEWLSIIFQRVSTQHFDGILQYLAKCRIDLHIGQPGNGPDFHRPPLKDK